MAKIALMCMLFALVAVAHSASVPAEKPSPLDAIPEALENAYNALKDTLNQQNLEELRAKAVQTLEEAKKFGDEAKVVGDKASGFTQEKLTEFLNYIEAGAKTFQENLKANTKN